jgi:hypothetical protein
MKELIMLFPLLLLISCFGEEFKVDQCVQKPDESTVWRITEFNEGFAKIKITKQGGSPISEKEVALPGGYIKTKCR